MAFMKCICRSDFQPALKTQEPSRTKAQTDSMPLRWVPAPRFKKKKKKEKKKEKHYKKIY